MAFQQLTAFASAARTATPTSAILEVPDEADTAEIVVATSASATPSTVVNIESQDNEGAWSVLLASAAIAANGTVRLLVGKNVSPVANVAAQAVLGRLLRVRPVHGNGNSHTYSIAVRMR